MIRHQKHVWPRCITSKITGTEEKTLSSEPTPPRSPVHRFGTPGMAINLWGVSPLYENEVLKVGSIPTVTPIEKVLEACNCGRVTDRGEEATSQSCEVTDRNSIQGRCGPVSEPTITKPSSFIRIGKSRACAAKVGRLIQGELESVSGVRLAELGSRVAQAPRRFQQSAEAVVRSRRTPLAIGRAEP